MAGVASAAVIAAGVAFLVMMVVIVVAAAGVGIEDQPTLGEGPGSNVSAWMS